MVRLISLCAVVALVACDDPEDTPICQEGEEAACWCHDGRGGGQICRSGAFTACECPEGADADADADGDNDGDADLDSDGNGDADLDNDEEQVTDGDELDGEAEEIDGDLDSERPPCEGWQDPATGLCWESPVGSGGAGWHQVDHGTAVAYCEGLAGGWHLPTIDDLRTLIRGCPYTEPGGECPVGEGCLIEDCAANGSGCDWCLEGGGTGPGNCYIWREENGPICGDWWSGSLVERDDGESIRRAWVVRSSNGAVDAAYFSWSASARCVR